MGETAGGTAGGDRPQRGFQGKAIERLLRGYWEAIERLLRGYWEARELFVIALWCLKKELEYYYFFILKFEYIFLFFQNFQKFFRNYKINQEMYSNFNFQFLEKSSSFLRGRVAK